MFSWFKNCGKGKQQKCTPELTRIYAIGDIHGSYGLLQKLHRLIGQDAASAAENIRKVIIYIGDYIDRGLESRQVIESFISPEMEGFERVFIKGNHEHAMLGFVDNPAFGEEWLTWGGGATLQSYGVAMTDDVGGRLEMEPLSAALERAIPEAHLNFLRSLPTSHVEGDYVFVHAGVKPGIPLSAQTDEDLMMLRGDFIYVENPMPEKIVVFGHTIFEEPLCDGGKIGIDTGAYASGKLTAVVLEGSSVRFINT